MADITMCTQTLCPNARQCYRVQAAPSVRQRMQTYHYTIGVSGVQCENYTPMYRGTTSDRTVTRRSEQEAQWMF